MDMSFERPVIIFDPKCSLCLQIKGIILKLDQTKVFQLVSLYDSKLFEEFDNLSFDECYGKVHVVDEDDNVWVGPLAVEFILNRLVPNPMAQKILSLAPIRTGISIGYDLLNAYRLRNAPPCEQCRP